MVTALCGRGTNWTRICHVRHDPRVPTSCKADSHIHGNSSIDLAYFFSPFGVSLYAFSIVGGLCASMAGIYGDWCDNWRRLWDIENIDGAQVGYYFT